MPPSLLVAARDLALVAVAGFAACVAVTGLTTRRDIAQFTERHGYAYADFSWGQAVEPSVRWTLGVLAWAFAVWCATRARSGRRSAWLPGALAVSVVLVRATASALPDEVWVSAAVEQWPGVWLPFTWRDDGTVALDGGSPAWAYPVLVVALLAGAAWLGAHAGRWPDDRAARRVAAPPRAGLALAAVVVGLPALGGTAGAAAAFLAAMGGSTGPAPETASWLTAQLGLPLLTALAATALLSGTGPLGVLATALVALPVVADPFQGWLVGGADALLGQAAGAAVATVAIALWRPAAAWGGEVLGPVRVPAAGSLPE